MKITTPTETSHGKSSNHELILRTNALTKIDPPQDSYDSPLEIFKQLIIQYVFEALLEGSDVADYWSFRTHRDWNSISLYCSHSIVGQADERQYAPCLLTGIQSILVKGSSCSPLTNSGATIRPVFYWNLGQPYRVKLQNVLMNNDMMIQRGQLNGFNVNTGDCWILPTGVAASRENTTDDNGNCVDAFLMPSGSSYNNQIGDVFRHPMILKDAINTALDFYRKHEKSMV